MKQGTQSRCSGTTQRDGVGKEVGEGVQGIGHMCTYGKNHQYCKVIILQLK